jgi:hypothetical protein
MAEFVDYIGMNLNDPNITAHDGRSQRVDPGTYDFEVDKAVFDQSRKGNRTLRVTARVIAVHDPAQEAMKGRSMVCSYVISDEEFARRRMKAIIEATGAQLDQQGGFSRESLIGLRFTGDVVIDTFDDIDAKTGQPVTRDVTKWNGERPCGGEAPAAQAPRAAAPAPAPAQAGGAPRRPAAPQNGRPTAPR